MVKSLHLRWNPEYWPSSAAILWAMIQTGPNKCGTIRFITRPWVYWAQYFRCQLWTLWVNPGRSEPTFCTSARFGREPSNDQSRWGRGSGEPIVERRTTSNVPMQCFKMACADKNCIRRSVKQTNKFNYFWTMNSYEPWILYASMSILNYSKEITLIDAKLAEIEPSKIMLFWH